MQTLWVVLKYGAMAAGVVLALLAAIGEVVDPGAWLTMPGVEAPKDGEA